MRTLHHFSYTLHLQCEQKQQQNKHSLTHTLEKFYCTCTYSVDLWCEDETLLGDLLCFLHLLGGFTLNLVQLQRIRSKFLDFYDEIWYTTCRNIVIAATGSKVMQTIWVVLQNK